MRYNLKTLSTRIALFLLLYQIHALGVGITDCPTGYSALSADAPRLVQHLPGPYEPVLGEEVKSLSNAAQTVYRIARGFLGENILRIVPTDSSQPSYILKEYNLPHKFDVELRGYTFLGGLTRGIQTGETFRIVSARRKSGQLALILDDVYGRNLKDVLADRRIKPELKQKILERYTRQVNRLDELIKARMNEKDLRSATQWEGGLSISYTLENGGQPIELSIRPSQIVVSFNQDNPEIFDLTLVDPF